MSLLGLTIVRADAAPLSKKGDWLLGGLRGEVCAVLASDAALEIGGLFIGSPIMWGSAWIVQLTWAFRKSSIFDLSPLSL